MKNWKTTLGGLLGAAGATLQTSDDPTTKAIGYVLLGAGLLVIGLFGKDSNVTGAGPSATSM